MKKLSITLLIIVSLSSASLAQITAIRAGKLIDPKSGNVLSNQIILIEGTRIKSVGANLSIPRDATVIAVLSILLVEALGMRIYGRSFMFPWMYGSDITVISASIQTGSSRAWGPSPTEQIFVLAGIILTFVICPTVYLFGWYRRRIARASSPAQRPLTITSVAQGFCGIVTIVVAISIGPIALLQEASTTSRCEADASRIQRDGMINEMKLLGVDAYTYRVRPKDLDGGSGSYAGYVIPERLARSENGEYTATVSADSMSLKGESATCATNTVSATVNRSGQVYGWRFEGNWLGFG
ncbi:MAG: hypothetical protein FJ217_15755 [Ignavibacteria bacterium]|nr:hypothetical protein [Ignavibacteria bacterium]